MKKILYTQFKNLDEIMDELSQNKEIKRAITRSNLYKFWSKISGEKFSKVSRPYSMTKNHTMIIACKTPAVAQELMLHKTQLLVKFKPYVESLHIRLNDLKFDPKKWIEDID